MSVPDADSTKQLSIDALLDRVRELEDACATLEEQLDVKLDNVLPSGTARLTVEELQAVWDTIHWLAAQQAIPDASWQRTEVMVSAKLKEAKGE